MEATNANDEYRVGCAQKRFAWMTYYVAIRIDQAKDLITLQLLKVLSKNQHGERRWMMKLKPLKEMTLESYLIF